MPLASLSSPSSLALLLLWVGCYVTDTGGSQAAQHRSTAAYTIARQTETIFITQARSNCPPSHPASIPATHIQGLVASALLILL